MNGATVTLKLPAGLYTELQALAQEEHTEPVVFLSQLITTARERRAWVNETWRCCASKLPKTVA